MEKGTETIKICPQCGALFGCDPVSCWCSKLPPVMPMVENADCYCPQCLAEMIEKAVA